MQSGTRLATPPRRSPHKAMPRDLADHLDEVSIAGDGHFDTDTESEFGEGSAVGQGDSEDSREETHDINPMVMDTPAHATPYTPVEPQISGSVSDYTDYTDDDRASDVPDQVFEEGTRSEGTPTLEFEWGSSDDGMSADSREQHAHSTPTHTPLSKSKPKPRPNAIRRGLSKREQFEQDMAREYNLPDPSEYRGGGREGDRERGLPQIHATTLPQTRSARDSSRGRDLSATALPDQDRYRVGAHGNTPAHVLLGRSANLGHDPTRLTKLAPAPPSVADIVGLGMSVYWGSTHGAGKGVDPVDIASDADVDTVATALRLAANVDPEVALWLSAQHIARGNYLQCQEVLESTLGDMMSVGVDQAAAGPVLFDCLFNCAAAMAAEALFVEAAHEWSEVIDVTLDSDLVSRSGLSATLQRRLLFEGIANRAWCLLQTGDSDAAVKSFEPYLDMLDDDVTLLTGPVRGSGIEPGPVALCLYVLARAYLREGKHELSHAMFMEAADVELRGSLEWAQLMVWATVVAHSAGGGPAIAGTAAASHPKWLIDAFISNGTTADAVLKAVVAAPDIQIEWVGIVCHQAAYSTWLLNWPEATEVWIMRGVEGMGSIVGQETFNLLLLCAQFFEGHTDKVQCRSGDNSVSATGSRDGPSPHALCRTHGMGHPPPLLHIAADLRAPPRLLGSTQVKEEIQFLNKLLQMARDLGKHEYIDTISDEIDARVAANQQDAGASRLTSS
jgi:hypothetical protein